MEEAKFEVGDQVIAPGHWLYKDGKNENKPGVVHEVFRENGSWKYRVTWRFDEQGSGTGGSFKEDELELWYMDRDQDWFWDQGDVVIWNEPNPPIAVIARTPALERSEIEFAIPGGSTVRLRVPNHTLRLPDDNVNKTEIP